MVYFLSFYHNIKWCSSLDMTWIWLIKSLTFFVGPDKKTLLHNFQHNISHISRFKSESQKENIFVRRWECVKQRLWISWRQKFLLQQWGAAASMWKSIPEEMQTSFSTAAGVSPHFCLKDLLSRPVMFVVLLPSAVIPADMDWCSAEVKASPSKAAAPL